ncbi:ABC-F family ATP-binding cassette domain-containing protein [Raoultibacter massiliensis]|uniref:ABC-F family ATP-binding cassette domain-containing protein n=1 Tax=Raoultibacter massiliensis TaxID=1852371 RepID=A0ABV1JAL6_9ACTN|nr:ABC-F family ATP-binding cassette domain-containing protein [Raoultibacter massiliensis]
MPVAILITAKDVELEFPTKRVFDSVTLGVNTADRIGIVGKNGDGKSTLLSLLDGSLAPDAGEIIRRGGVTVGRLAQADNLNDEDTVEHAVVGDAPEYTWASDRSIREIIAALLGDIPWNGIVGELSGGQRRRVDLARLLIGDWDVLMLDEPTNHLDVKAISWLAEHLRGRWPQGEGALLVVTHDRWFLDEVCTSMWEVHDGIVEPFEGGYSAYILQRVERDRQAQVAEQKRRNLARKELAWLSRGARARSSKPKFHLDIARELIADEPPVRNPLELKRVAVARLGKQVIDLLGVSESFGEKTVLDDVTWLIGPGDRYGILGENGAGKTTLLRVIQGDLPPTKGRVKIGKTVKVAVLSQRLDELDDLASDRVREVLARYHTRYVIDGKSITPAQLLERLGFERSHLQARIADLSGGQKRRLQLLLTLLQEPNVLILDEPGNDMDTDMLAVMEDLLDSWPGTLILVSHDRYLMERVTDDQYALIDGQIRHMPGGVDEFLRALDERDAAPKSAAGASAAKAAGQTAAESPADSADERSRAALVGGDAYQARKTLASTERKISSLEAQIEKTRAAMHDIDPTDFIALGDKQAEIQTIQEQINELEELWIDLSEKLGD